ncbi:MAG TPA: MerR family transcriptional regulator [Pseudonocardiaceae bacterium]|nr:MerR family transcriptional regulator [Pseudonocardiaceae bacterium]
MTAAGRSTHDGLSIGAVLTELRPEFPEVTISKIRFLESEGLVRPARSPAGYRQFTRADIDRLRFVLSAQRDHYLPLKVIKEQLEAADRGLRPGTPTARLPRPLDAGDGLPAPRDFAPGEEIRLTREELAAEAEIDSALLAEIEQYGLIRRGPTGYYHPDCVLVAATARAMTEFGIEPRHLRAFRASADREVGLLEQVVAPLYRQRAPEAKERADEVVRELAALSVTLHTLLVKAGLAGGRV